MTEALQARGEGIDFCVVGEPTAVNYARRHGQEWPSWLALRQTHGQGHPGAYRLSASGQNPIHMAAPAIAELAATVWDEGNEFFPPTTWRISNIKGGTGAITSPAPSDPLQLPLLDRQHPGRAAAAPRSGAAAAWASTTRSSGRWAPPLPDRRRRPGRRGAQRDPRRTRHRSGIVDHRRHLGWSLHRADLPQVIEIGPVNATIHKIDECVEAAALPKLSGIYRRILEQLLT